MAEHDDTQPEELTPEQEARVRRLLADARHTDPTPDAVVARLDRVLAGLAEEPARSAAVVRLADRRRRAATMLVAAAASVAAVIGVGAVVSNTDSGGADLATSGEAEDAEAPGAATDEDTASGPENYAGGRAAFRASQRRMPFILEAERFARDARSLESQASSLSDLRRAEGNQDAPGLTYGNLDRAGNRTVCEPGAWGGGSYIAVVYDGAEGWVVLRRPQGDTQIADLFLCGSESVVRSVTLPYP